MLAMLVRMSVATGDNASGMATLAYIGGFLITMFDIVRGDIYQLLGRRQAVNYEVIQPLKNQVMVCRWHGPPHLNPHYVYPEKICGINPREQRSERSRIVLIAVVQGILCELEPFEPDQDQRWFEDAFISSSCSNGDWTLPFCGCDVYDEYAHDYRKLGEIEARKTAGGGDWLEDEPKKKGKDDVIMLTKGNRSR